MGSYYYLVAQLPNLIYGQAPSMSSEAFKELAKPILSKTDAALLDTISFDLQATKQEPSEDSPKPLSQAPVKGKIADAESLSTQFAEKAPPCGSDFIDHWREWERTLRLNIAKQRFIRKGLKWDALPELPEEPADAVSLAVKAVAATESPLEVEFLLDKARWNAIEEMQGSNFFTCNTIFAYLLKLLILERHASLQAEKGFSEYKLLYASIMENAQTSAAGEYT